MLECFVVFSSTVMLVCVFFRVKILEQFVETVHQLKGQRQHTVHMHVCAALCSLLQVLRRSRLSCCNFPEGETLTAACRLQRQGSARGSLGPEEVRAPSLSLLSAALESSGPLMRCLAAEGLARLVQVVGDPGFSVSASLLCFDRCRQSLLR